MRKIVTAAFVSIDGVMQAPGGPEEDRSGGFKYGGWTVPFFDDTAGAIMGELFSTPYDLLLGRRTYDIFAAYWPNIQEDPKASDFNEGTARISKQFNAVTKYVATHHPDGLKWQNTQSLGPDVVGRLRELKRQDGPRLLTQGSSQLIQTLLANDLIDELRLLVFPVLLGRGKRLFGEGTPPLGLELVASSTSPSGVVVTTYERAGEVKTGSFA